MGKVIYDPNTKTMVPQSQFRIEKGGYVRLSMDEALATTLKGYAKADGFDFIGKDDVENKAKVSNAIRKYVEAAVQEFIASREALG